MSSIQSQVIRHAMKQKSTTCKEWINQSIEMIQLIELDGNIKSYYNILHLFKKVEESMNMTKKNREDIKK